MSDSLPFRRTYPLEVRFRDLDAMGHVNNAVFFTYLEEARLRYTRDVLEPLPPADRPPGFIVASARLDYRLPLFLGDTLDIGVAVAWFGRTSYGLAYEVRSRAQHALAAVAETVQVVYDYKAKRAIELPPSFREAVTRFEGRAIPAREARPA